MEEAKYKAKTQCEDEEIRLGGWVGAEIGDNI